MIKFSCGSSRVWWPHLCSLLLVRVWNALLCLEKAVQPLRALEPWDHPCCDWLLSRVRGQNPWPRGRKHKKCSVHIQKGSCYYCTEWCFDAIALNFISLYLLNFWLLVSPGWIILAEKYLIKVLSSFSYYWNKPLSSSATAWGEVLSLVFLHPLCAPKEIASPAFKCNKFLTLWSKDTHSKLASGPLSD